MTELCNKTVIVTGAGQGIGRAVAVFLAAQGVNVVVNDLDDKLAQEVSTVITKSGGNSIAVPGSVANWEFVSEMIVKTLTTFSRLDGLINNAGLHYSGPPWDEQGERIQQLVDVNVVGSLYCGSQALKVFVAQGCGVIINLTSGAHIGVADQSAYCATKGAIASLTYAWAIDAMRFGVRVNAVAPLAKTRMTDSLPDYRDSATISECAALAPLFGFLLSDAAAGITGQIIRFNGSDLSLIKHPAIGEQSLSAEHWDINNIAQAFNETLSQQFNPVGLGVKEYQWPTQ